MSICKSLYAASEASVGRSHCLRFVLTCSYQIFRSSESCNIVSFITQPFGRDLSLLGVHVSLAVVFEGRTTLLLLPPILLPPLLPLLLFLLLPPRSFVISFSLLSPSSTSLSRALLRSTSSTSSGDASPMSSLLLESTLASPASDEGGSGRVH